MKRKIYRVVSVFLLFTIFTNVGFATGEIASREDVENIQGEEVLEDNLEEKEVVEKEGGEIGSESELEEEKEDIEYLEEDKIEETEESLEHKDKKNRDFSIRVSDLGNQSLNTKINEILSSSQGDVEINIDVDTDYTMEENLRVDGNGRRISLNLFGSGSLRPGKENKNGQYLFELNGSQEENILVNIRDIKFLVQDSYISGGILIGKYLDINMENIAVDGFENSGGTDSAIFKIEFTDINIGGATSFNNNISKKGVFYMTSENGKKALDKKINISGNNIEFINNRSELGAASINIWGGNLNIYGNNIKFNENEVWNTSRAGAISVHTGDLNISGSDIEFNRNISKSGAGSIFFIGKEGISEGGFNIQGKNIQFLDNQGGAGGVVSLSRGELSLQGDITFKGNKASVGGAIHFDGETGLKTDGVDSKISFEENSANNGGALFFNLTQRRTIELGGTSINFIGNKAQEGGGAVSGTNIDLDITSDQINILDNSAGYIGDKTRTNRGGALYIKGDINLLAKEVVAKGNRARTTGGVIHGKNLQIEKAESLDFQDNMAERNGGAIYLEEDLNIVDNRTVLFKNNGVTFKNGELLGLNNTGNINGGALYTRGNISMVNNEEAIFEGNRVVFSENKNMSFKNGQSFNGGAIYSEKAVEFDNRNLYLVENSVDFLNNGLIVLHEGNTNFKGGAVYAGEGVEFLNTRENNLLFKNNKVRLTHEDIGNLERVDSLDLDGAAIYSESISEVPDNIIFINNLVEKNNIAENKSVYNGSISMINREIYLKLKDKKGKLIEELSVNNFDGSKMKPLELTSSSLKKIQESKSIQFTTMREWDNGLLIEKDYLEGLLVYLNKVYDEGKLEYDREYLFLDENKVLGKSNREVDQTGYIVLELDNTRPVDPDPIDPVNPDPVEPEPIDPIEPPITPPITPEIEKKLNKQDHMAYIEGYKDGSIRPEDHITREEVAAIFYRLLDEDFRLSIYSEENSFTDLNKGRWSNKHISTLTNGGLVEGYPNGEFRHSNKITRAEVAAIIFRLEGLEESKESGFKDVKNHWAEKYIGAVSQEGWVEGYPNGNFKPDQNITRGEFVTMVNNALNRKVLAENLVEGTKVYPDLKVGKWYYLAMVEASNGHEYTRDKKTDQEIWTELKEFDIDM